MTADRHRTYDDLTQRQKWALQALIAEISRRPIAETISECVRLRLMGRATDQARDEYRRALASGRAAQLAISYLKYLEDVNNRHMQLGATIREKLKHPYPTSREETRGYVEAELDAIELAGIQEILMLDFANTCIQIHSLLQKAAEGAAYKMPQKDLDALNAYRPLRDYSAHIYNRLPGGPNEKEVVTEITDHRGWQVIIGFEIDDQGRVVLGDHRVEVNSRGLERVTEIGKRTLGALSPSAIAKMHHYFVEHPEHIPAPSAVRRDILTRVARPEERSSREAARQSPS